MEALSVGHFEIFDQLRRHGFTYNPEDGLFHRNANGIASKAAISQVRNNGVDYVRMVVEADDPQAEDGKSKSSFMIPESPESKQARGLGCSWHKKIEAMNRG